MYEEKLKKWIHDNQQEIVELNKRIISIPSVNRYPDGDEAEVQKEIYEWLNELGCQMDTFIPTDVKGLTAHPAYLENRNYTNRPNVVGKLVGSGGGKSILFSGHMDTVPLDDEPWSDEPFSGMVKDGKQYGLGIYDMKSGMVAAITALRAIRELGITLKGDITIETVVDEEYGGANATLACRLRGYEADIAIIPEPTNMVICPATQGGGMYRITFRGKSGRSYRGEKLINPAYAGAKFIEIFRKYETYHEQKRSDSPHYKDGPTLPAYIQGVKSGMVQLPLTDRVPGSFTIDLWIQCYPGTTEEELTRDFMQFYEEKASHNSDLKNINLEIERLIRFLPGTEIDENHPFVTLATEVSENVVGSKLDVRGAPFACDAFMFNLYSDTPAIIWGPMGANAHAANEYIEVAPFFKLVEMYALAIMRWCQVDTGVASNDI